MFNIHVLILILDSDVYRWRNYFVGCTSKLYGLIHARHILTPMGQAQMMRKTVTRDYGVCYSAGCNNQNYSPIALSDEFGVDDVKIFSPKDQGINQCFKTVDAAFFGKRFPHLLIMTNPGVFPEENL